jgi:hypothetical protein
MQVAQAEGGHGATIASDAENEFAFALVIPSGNAIWLGGRGKPGDCGNAASYQWVTGEEMAFVDWLKGEPNGWPGTTECGLSFHPWFTTPQWNDTPIDPAWTGPFIIEWSADCNADGIVDYGQILAGELEDANANNIPDCCEDGTSCTPCAGDVDESGAVNGVDLAAVLNNWGTNGGKYPRADINGDGTVDASDLAFVLSTWGACP